MGLFTDLLFPLKIVQSSSRIKTAGWGERGWNWNDQERKNVTVGLRNRDLVNDACEEFVVARLRMTKRTKWWRHNASRETYHLVFALVDPPRQELPLKIRKTNHLRKYATKRRKWRDLSSQRVTPLKCFPFLIYPCQHDMTQSTPNFAMVIEILHVILKSLFGYIALSYSGRLKKGLERKWRSLKRCYFICLWILRVVWGQRSKAEYLFWILAVQNTLENTESTCRLVKLWKLGNFLKLKHPKCSVFFYIWCLFRRRLLFFFYIDF